MAKSVSLPESSVDASLSIVPMQNRRQNTNEELDKVLIKEYEAHLLMSGFGMVIPKYDEISLIPEVLFIAERLDIDIDTKKRFKKTLCHFGYHHSPLCLLEDPILVALSVYHFTCHITNTPLAPKWATFDVEERRVAESLSSHMNQTVTYVAHRRTQMKQQQVAPILPLRTEGVEVPDLERLLKEILSDKE